MPNALAYSPVLIEEHADQADILARTYHHWACYEPLFGGLVPNIDFRDVEQFRSLGFPRWSCCWGMWEKTRVPYFVVFGAFTARWCEN